MTPNGLETLVTAGGTAGLIAFCLFVIYKLGGGAWIARETVHERIEERDQAHEREVALLTTERDRAIANADLLLPAVQQLTRELERSRERRRGDSS